MCSVCLASGEHGLSGTTEVLTLTIDCHEERLRAGDIFDRRDSVLKKRPNPVIMGTTELSGGTSRC